MLAPRISLITDAPAGNVCAGNDSGARAGIPGAPHLGAPLGWLFPFFSLLAELSFVPTFLAVCDTPGQRFFPVQGITLAPLPCPAFCTINSRLAPLLEGSLRKITKSSPEC